MAREIDPHTCPPGFYWVALRCAPHDKFIMQKSPHDDRWVGYASLLRATFPDHLVLFGPVAPYTEEEESDKP